MWQQTQASRNYSGGISMRSLDKERDPPLAHRWLMEAPLPALEIGIYTEQSPLPRHPQPSLKELFVSKGLMEQLTVS